MAAHDAKILGPLIGMLARFFLKTSIKLIPGLATSAEADEEVLEELRTSAGDSFKPRLRRSGRGEKFQAVYDANEL